MAGPLDGVTVIDLTTVVAGPLATQLFAQQGARVLKIEPPEGDRARALGAIAAPGFSAVHETLNAGKRSIGLANRLVETGAALAEAQAMAATIAAFPETCMRTDRMAAYRQWGESVAEALRSEARHGAAPLQSEAAIGAARFTSGTGRNGRFD